ncbi:MAG TPA: hypothetical protein VGL56_02395 [Fimbriimonadaceae bacterium]|jgi:hypothetical protein
MLQIAFMVMAFAALVSLVFGRKAAQGFLQWVLIGFVAFFAFMAFIIWKIDSATKTAVADPVIRPQNTTAVSPTQNVTSTNSDSSYTQRSQQWIACAVCGGKGRMKCPYCGGRHYLQSNWTPTPEDSIPPPPPECPFCGFDGTVTCSACGGAGGHWQ